jgi:DNA modification methylase
MSTSETPTLGSCIEFGDCRDTMRRWAREGIKAQICVTSPPYYGQRDYGHEGQLGLEQTPEQYITAMVEVFRCVRDVLADDGTLWLIIGDSYAGTGKSGGGAQGKRWEQYGMDTEGPRGGQWIPPPDGLKRKDLIGIPWMLAFALRADGWFLRQDIIWNKPNPVPESVRDRCTKAHEYIFLLSKSERYFFDSEAMQEPSVGGNRWPVGAGQTPGKPRQSRKRGEFNGKTNAMPGHEAFRAVTDTRNRRSVWTIATSPYKGAHFATFPAGLVEPCILAGSRPGDTVVDPFIGSGTTAAVAAQLGRKYLGCELNPTYGPLQNERIRKALWPGLKPASERDAHTIDLFPEAA